MWKNNVQRGRPQVTIWRMRIACWIPKATNTYLEYVILITVPLQQCCTNAPQCDVVSTLVVMLNVKFGGTCCRANQWVLKCYTYPVRTIGLRVCSRTRVCLVLDMQLSCSSLAVSVLYSKKEPLILWVGPTCDL